MAIDEELSKSQVNRAGEWLLDWWQNFDPGRMSREEPLQEAALTLFAYREGFQNPLKKVTVGVRQFVQRETKGRITVGQRLKREPQIIRKLSRFPKMKLARMQDIGGCRAIVDGGLPEIRRVEARMRKNRWDIRGYKDYVAEPAGSGYRAIHVVVLRDGHPIEIQLRTPRQHEWAEAVERTALRTRFDLKDGEGPSELLYYFRMAADALALEEMGEVPDDAFMAAFHELRDEVRPYLVTNR